MSYHVDNSRRPLLCMPPNLRSGESWEPSPLYAQHPAPQVLAFSEGTGVDASPANLSPRDLPVSTDLIAADRTSQTLAYIDQAVPIILRDLARVEPPSVLTSYEREEHQLALQGAISFVTPPTKEEYYDECLKKTYYNPDHSHLVPLALSYFAEGEYRGIGLTRRKHLILSGEDRLCCCDFLCFTKLPDQISYENKPYYPWVRPLAARTVKKRIEQQREIYRELLKILPKMATTWGYDDRRICYFSDRDQLCAAGFSAEDAQQIHAIALFYKEKQERGPK